MGRVIRYGRDAPPVGAVIDWGHPLADGLVSCLPFESGTSVDAVDGNPAILLTNGTYAGPGMRPGFGGTTLSGARYATSPSQRLTGAMTCTVVATHEDTTNWRQAMFGAGEGLNATLNFYLLATSTGYTLGFFASGGFREFTASASHTLGRRHSVSGRWDWANGGAGAVIRDGLTLGSGTQAFTPSGTQVSNTIGTLINAAWAESFRGLIHCYHLHNRALTAHEVAWLHDEPYAMFMFERRRTYYTAPSGGWKAYWLRQSRLIGGGFIR